MLVVLFFSWGCKKSSTVPVSFSPQEITALTDLYDSTNGAQWINNTNWFNYSATYWKGVEIAVPANKGVVGITLDTNNLAGVIPSSISGLSNLKYLILSNNNNIIGSIPSSIGSLTNLQTLYLNNTSLSGVIPDAIMNLVNLTGGSLSNKNLDTLNSSAAVKAFLKSKGISYNPPK